MNIFILSHCPQKAALGQCDKHVVKMLLETAQLLSTAHHECGAGGPYKRTHTNHPCAVWARATTGNYAWAIEHGLALSAEYTHRYGRVHKSAAVVEALMRPPARTPVGARQAFAQCMPEMYRQGCAVTAYRSFYRGEKAQFARWDRGRTAPDWWLNES